jgi:hypothetical protein
MKSGVRFLLLVALVVALGSATVWAQSTVEISGSVTDVTGALLPGVDVSATNTGTGITRATVSNETGSYVLTNLPTGPYRLEVSLPGFQTYVQTGIQMQVGSNVQINVALQVGQVAQTIEVQANASLVETRNVSIGQVMDNERILELPLNGRNVQELITLSGGAVRSGTSNAIALQGIPEIAIAGAFQSATTYMLDGAMHNNTYSNNSLPQPFPDALQEFQVETGVRSARSGRNAGAQVSSVTKSGTNEFHGNAFWFVRNDLLNAREYFARSESTLKRNQYGGTIGGPIAENRLFFFAGYQGTTVRQDPADERVFIPTADMLRGDLTTFASAACNSGRRVDLEAPYVDNRIDPALFSPAAVNLAARLPTTNDPCGEITFGVRENTDEHQVLSRVDYQLNDEQSLFGRVYFVDPDEAVPFSFDESNVLLTDFNGYDNWVAAYAAGHTYLISPTTVNSLRLSANRWEAVRAKGSIFSAPDLGVNIFSYENDQTRVSVDDGFDLGTNNGPMIGNSFALTEELSLTRGDHQLTFGSNAGYSMSFLRSNVRTAGNFDFDGLSDFLIGEVAEFQQTPQTNAIVTQWHTGFFGADVWRLTPTVTVNYGLRWEPYIPQVRRNGSVDNFSEARYAAGQKTIVYDNAPFGFIYPGDPDFVGGSPRGDGTFLASGQNIHWGDISPRLGLAWDMFGDGRMSVRAAFGRSYEQLTGGLFAGFISPPWDNRVILDNPVGGFDDPWLDFPGGNPFPTPQEVTADALFVPNGSYYSLSPDLPTTSRNQWNLSIQRQFGQDLTVETTYIGSQAAHIWYNNAINYGLYVPGVGDANGNCFLDGVQTPFTVRAGSSCSSTRNLNDRRRLNMLYPNIGGTTLSYVDEYTNGGTQSYHGLLLSVQRRATDGVNFGTNYTYSHCYGDDNVSQSGHGGNPDRTVRPGNRDADRGNCRHDRRHVFNLTSVLQTPEFANPTTRTLASNWRLSTIFRRSSGAFLTADLGRRRDQARSGVADQRANQVLDDVFLDKSGDPGTLYLNADAFAQPALGTYGNIGPRNIKGIGTWDLDVALARTFQLGETQQLEFRAEAYNLTNSFRAVNPEDNIRSRNFGRIRRALAPRILQFALKFAF